MNKGLKYILAAAAVMILVVIYAFLLAGSGMDRAGMACSEIDIRMKDSLRFITAEDVRNFVDRKCGTVIGQRIDSVNLAQIERTLEEQSAIMNCEAWVGRDGILHLEVSQRLPVLRLNKGSEGFYIDGSGYIFPLHPSFTADVPMIGGDIPVKVPRGYKGEAPTEKEREWISSILRLHAFTSESRKTGGNIADISVGRGGDIQLKFAGEDEIFILGNAERLEEKFSMIAQYREYVRPSVEPGHYKRINVKYNNQIICRKGI